MYYPYNIIKLTAKPSDDFTEETDGFNGHIVMFEPIKSSSNQSGNDRKGLSFEMVFSFKEGFDTLRTMEVGHEMPRRDPYFFNTSTYSHQIGCLPS